MKVFTLTTNIRFDDGQATHVRWVDLRSSKMICHCFYGIEDIALH